MILGTDTDTYCLWFYRCHVQIVMKDRMCEVGLVGLSARCMKDSTWDFLFLLWDPVKLQIKVPTTIQSNKLVLKFHAGGTVTSTSEGTSKSNMVSSDLTWQLLFSHYDSKRNHLCQLQEGCSRPVAQNPSKWFDCKVNLEFRWFFCLNPFSPSSLNQSPNTRYET